MITPDAKDWTWVLEHPCPDCGFDAAAQRPTEVPRLLRDNAAWWQAQLAAGGIHATRPDEATWSPLEYACHVRDVHRRFDGRLGQMLTTDDPRFDSWDQDATAVEDRYHEQDPATVVADLVAAAHVIAGHLEQVDGDAWDRPGRRSDGASFTVATLALYLVHDPLHHAWDLTGEPTR